MGRHRLDYIMEKICSEENLYLGAEETKSVNCGADALRFYDHLNTNIILLHNDLMTDRYHPSTYQSFNLSYPRKRKIYTLEFSDKVVQSSIYRVLKEEFQNSFYEHTYASMTNRGIFDAKEYIQDIISYMMKTYGTYYCIKGDIHSFHSNIEISILKSRLRDYIGDPRLLKLLYIFLDHTEGIPDKDPHTGIITGNKLNSFYTSIYMDPFDRYVKQDLHVKFYLRYEDDFLIFLPSIEEARNVLPKIESFLLGRLNLSLNQKTRIISSHEGIPFCGIKFYRNRSTLMRSSIDNTSRFLKWYQDDKISFKELTDKLVSWTSHAEHCGVPESLIEKIWFEAYSSYVYKHGGMSRLERRKIIPKCMRKIRYYHLSINELNHCTQKVRFRLIQKKVITTKTKPINGRELRSYLNIETPADGARYFDITLK